MHTPYIKKVFLLILSALTSSIAHAALSQGWESQSVTELVLMQMDLENQGLIPMPFNQNSDQSQPWDKEADQYMYFLLSEYGESVEADNARPSILPEEPSIYRYDSTTSELEKVEVTGDLPGRSTILGQGSWGDRYFIVTEDGLGVEVSIGSLSNEHLQLEFRYPQLADSAPSCDELSNCKFTQVGSKLCFTTTTKLYIYDMVRGVWEEKTITGTSPDSLSGMSVCGWTDEDNTLKILVTGGFDSDGSVSNQGYVLDVDTGTMRGTQQEYPPYTGTIPVSQAYTASVYIEDCITDFAVESEILPQAMMDNFLLVGGTQNGQTPTNEVWIGDASRDWWWATDSRVNLPEARSGGSIVKLSIGGKATLLYYGGIDASGNLSNTIFRLNTDAPYEAPGSIPSYGLGAPATDPYTRIPLHYFSSNNNPSHVFTSVQAEVDNISTNLEEHYTYEGISHYVVGNHTLNAIPVYRLYNRLSGAHFYSSSREELQRILNNLWYFSIEGVAFFVFPTPEPGTLPVYRFFVPSTGSHYFTISEAEKNQLVNSGQQVRNYEGIAWYAYPAAE